MSVPNPYESWEPWPTTANLGGGPESCLTDDPPECMPVSRPVLGFTVPHKRRSRWRH